MINIILLFRKLFKIPPKRYRELFLRYSEAGNILDSHISHIKPFFSIAGSVQYHEPLFGEKSIKPAVYSPEPFGGAIGESREQKYTTLKKGLKDEDYDSFCSLCQRAEVAYNDGNISSARAIMDGLQEIALPDKVKVLQDCVKKLQTKIK